MRWQLPWSFTRLVAAWVAATVFVFLTVWAGKGNGSNPSNPGFWGDPIPLHNAVAQLPKLALAVAAAVTAAALVFGVRGDSDKT